MRRTLVPGEFAPGSTALHRVDPRVKVALLAAATIASFAAPAPWGLAVVAVGLVVALAASGTSPATVFVGLRPAAVVLGLSVLSNAVVLAGQPGLSTAGLARGVTVVARIALVVGFALVVSATTAPPALADALGSLLSPLERVGVPVGALSMSSSIALRFIPLAVEEVGRIRAAQRARGARLDEGGPRRRLALWAQVLVPLLVGLFRRADELADAMVDRCYAGGRVSALGPLARPDALALACGIAWAALAVAL